MEPGRQSPAQICRKCRRPVDAVDRFCRSCGARVGSTPWYLSRVAVLVWLFVFLGPLALPLLWRSDAFEWPAKAVLTALSFAQIAAIGWLFQGLYDSAMMDVLGQLR